MEFDIGRDGKRMLLYTDRGSWPPNVLEGIDSKRQSARIEIDGRVLDCSLLVAGNRTYVGAPLGTRYGFHREVTSLLEALGIEPGRSAVFRVWA